MKLTNIQSGNRTETWIQRAVKCSSIYFNC